MNKLRNKPRNERLYEAILSLRNVEECMMFFDDLCAKSELAAIEQRFLFFNDPAATEIYTDILSKTGASSATISRVNRSLQYGRGGFQMVFERMKDEEE